MNDAARGSTKKKTMPHRNLGCIFVLKWIGIVVGIIASPIVIYYGTIFLWVSQGTVQPSLAEELVLTAQNLLENPLESPIRPDDRFYVGMLDFSRDDGELCFVLSWHSSKTAPYIGDSEFVEGNVYFRYVEVYINDRLAGRTDEGGFLEMYRLMRGIDTACVEGILEDGLHIVEIRLLPRVFASPNYVQRWAVEVECDTQGCLKNPSRPYDYFSRARYAHGISPISEDLAIVANTFPTDYDYYDDVQLEINDLSVPTRNATEVCFIFTETPILSDDQYPNIGHLSINLGYEHTLFYNHYTNSNRICSDYSIPIGVNVITLQLPNSEMPYQWAIEIE